MDDDRIMVHHNQLRDELMAIADNNPVEAIVKARKLDSEENILHPDSIKSLQAIVFFIAGESLQNLQVIDEGIELLRESLKTTPTKFDTIYCLANGLDSKSRVLLSEIQRPEWFLHTLPYRHESRNLYKNAIKYGRDTNPSHLFTYEYIQDVLSRCYTNLACDLMHSSRLIEAYDQFHKALKHDPVNGVALTGLIKLLKYLLERGLGDRDVLLSEASKHCAVVKENEERLRKLVTSAQYIDLMHIVDTGIPSDSIPCTTDLEGYAKFVSINNLALSATLIGLDDEDSKWDTLHLHGIIEDITSEPGVPPIFTMFNVIKADYLAARHLTYQAIYERIADTGTYFDTLDFAVYGINESLISVSQKACYDILDKIALATCYYLGLPGNPKSILFSNCWFQSAHNSDTPDIYEWKPAIKSEIQKGSHALIALGEICADLKKSGFLMEKRVIRHTSTHRFHVIHDLEGGTLRPCDYIEHFQKNHFEEQTIDTLKLVRAAIFYFADLVNFREHRKKLESRSEGKVLGTLQVYDHDYIRGRGDTNRLERD